MSGVLPVEKGAGVTSFQVVAHLRRVLRAAKVGHGGTLDPDATGVLPILLGEGTKLTPYLVDMDKEYVATIRLGVSTETQDLSGAVVATHPVPALDSGLVAHAVRPFVGPIRQVPPMYSALHHQGRRLYELAREGRTVDREPREVVVHAIEVLSLALPDVVLRVRCGKGTYIRTLAADLGKALGCGGALATLVRTRVGPFALEDSVRWPDVRDARQGSPLRGRVLPLDSALGSFPPLRFDARQARAFVHGQPVDAPAAPTGRARVYGPDAELLGIGMVQGHLVRPERLLHADPRRPSVLPA